MKRVPPVVAEIILVDMQTDRRTVLDVTITNDLMAVLTQEIERQVNPKILHNRPVIVGMSFHPSASVGWKNTD